MVLREEKNRSLGPLLIILFVLVVLVGGLKLKEYWGSGRITEFLTGAKTTVLESRTDGSALKDFPGYLLNVATDSKIIRSDRLQLVDRTGTYEILSTTFESKGSVADLFAAYLAILGDRGYKIPPAPAAGDSFVAQGETDNVTVTVSNQIDRRVVQIDVKKLPSTK